MARSKRRQFVLLGPPTGAPQAPEAQPLGSLRSVRQVLAAFNTGPDGSPTEGATERLYGPGMTIEVSLGTDPVTQAIASVNDEPTAWPVLSRLCQAHHWRLMDIESGRIMSW
ncbi:MAG: hypothetical protein U0637_03060 [Phycisphaerales bacterium]